MLDPAAPFQSQAHLLSYLVNILAPSLVPTWMLSYDQIALSLHGTWGAPRASASTRVEVIDDWLAEHHRGEPYVVIDNQASGTSLIGSAHDEADRVLLCSVASDSIAVICPSSARR